VTRPGEALAEFCRETGWNAQTLLFPDTGVQIAALLPDKGAVAVFAGSGPHTRLETDRRSWTPLDSVRYAEYDLGLREPPAGATVLAPEILYFDVSRGDFFLSTAEGVPPAAMALASSATGGGTAPPDLKSAFAEDRRSDSAWIISVLGQKLVAL